MFWNWATVGASTLEINKVLMPITARGLNGYNRKPPLTHVIEALSVCPVEVADAMAWQIQPQPLTRRDSSAARTGLRPPTRGFSILLRGRDYVTLSVAIGVYSD